MKTRIYTPLLALLIAAFSASGCAQVKKVYAYKQASIPGNIIGNDENDIPENNVKKQTERKQNFNYWFYLSVPDTEKITITGLWINGNEYELTSETISTLPVKKIIHTGLERNDTIIMAPFTTNTIIGVFPRALTTIDPENSLQLAQSNELVIRYIWKNKIYYAKVQKINELAPDVRV